MREMTSERIKRDELATIGLGTWISLLTLSLTKSRREAIDEEVSRASTTFCSKMVPNRARLPAMSHSNLLM